jgi:hypothetical protein
MPRSVVIFGTEIPLGRLIGGLPPSEVKIAHAERIAGASPPRWLVRLEPATEQARNSPGWKVRVSVQSLVVSLRVRTAAASKSACPAKADPLAVLPKEVVNG